MGTTTHYTVAPWGEKVNVRAKRTRLTDQFQCRWNGTDYFIDAKTGEDYAVPTEEDQ